MCSKILLLIGLSIAVESTPLDYYDSGNSNSFVDSVLKAVLAKYNQTLGNYHLSDKVFSFKQPLGLITFDAEVKLSEGVITGLSHLYRSGDSTLNSENKQIKAHILFGDQSVHVHYKGKVSLMGLGLVHFTLDSQVGDVRVTTTIDLDSSGKPTLTEFQIDELEHVKVQIHTPIIILDPFIDLIAEGFIKVFNPMAKTIISTIMKDMVQTELEKFKLPIG